MLEFGEFSSRGTGNPWSSLAHQSSQLLYVWAVCAYVSSLAPRSALALQVLGASYDLMALSYIAKKRILMNVDF